MTDALSLTPEEARDLLEMIEEGVYDDFYLERWKQVDAIKVKLTLIANA